jgi:hypothetical protein
MHFSEIVPALFAGPDPDTQAKYLKTYKEAAFVGPYLMHEVLAFAARHLSLTKPEPKSKFYLTQATALQTTALSMFRASIREQTPETSLPSFLFSSLLGTHILTDTAAMHDLRLTEFLARFFDYIKVSSKPLVNVPRPARLRTSAGTSWSSLHLRAVQG